jgi:hypothetical protein
MSLLNDCLWAAGLALQLVLVAALFSRGVARRFPVFSSLIVFYVVRSFFVFTLFGYVAHETYSDLYTLLSWVDFLLQILLVVEIGVANLRQSGGWDGLSPRAASVGTALAFIACAIAMGVAALLPSPGRLPVDRGAAVIAVLMLSLLVWALWIKLAGPPRRIVEGFAVYSLAAVSIGLERSYAALYRNSIAIAAGSYAQAGVYLAAVVFWLLTIKPQEESVLTSARVSAHS